MADFYIVRKNVGGRIIDFHFSSWLNAEEWMKRDVKCGKVMGVWGECETQRKFLPGKGIYSYEIHGRTKKGEQVWWALLDGYFMDHILES